MEATMWRLTKAIIVSWLIGVVFSSFSMRCISLNEEIDSYGQDWLGRTRSLGNRPNLEPTRNNEPATRPIYEGRQNVQGARLTPPYRPCIAHHGFA
jgi:hypothetical protein